MSPAPTDFCNQESLLELDALPIIGDEAQHSQSLPFFKFPPEIRQRVYVHHLFFPERIDLVLGSCLTDSHQISYHPDEGMQILTCDQPWGRNKTRVPSSVLDLLLTSRLIYNEAVDIFYQINRFAFNDAHDIARFAKQGGKRFLQLRDISFPFNQSPAAFNQLRRCENLTKISIHFPLVQWGTAWPFKETSILRTVSGTDELMKLRNLKHVKLSGYDIVYDPASNRWIKVSLSHPGSIGEDLVSNLMSVSQEDQFRSSMSIFSSSTFGANNW